MMRKLSFLLLSLTAAGAVMAAPFEAVCPPCQPIGETDDGIFIARSRKTPSNLPDSNWFLTAFTSSSYGRLSHIDTLYQADCARHKVTAVELHLFDEADNELTDKGEYTPAVDRIRHSPKVHAIILRWLCPSR